MAASTLTSDTERWRAVISTSSLGTHPWKQHDRGPVFGLGDAPGCPKIEPTAAHTGVFALVAGLWASAARLPPAKSSLDGSGHTFDYTCLAKSGDSRGGHYLVGAGAWTATKT